MNYFGSFDRVQSFSSLDSDFSDDALKANGEADNNYAASGSMLVVGGKLQLKVGPVAIRSTSKAMQFSLDTNDGEPLFYESELDLLVPASGWAFQVDNDVLYFTDFGLMAGFRHTYATAFYSDELIAATATGEAPEANHRIGPFLAWRFHTDPLEKRTFFNEPTLVLLVNWYLSHTYRTGETTRDGSTTSQALPYIAMAFRFTGDMMDID